VWKRKHFNEKSWKWKELSSISFFEELEAEAIKFWPLPHVEVKAHVGKQSKFLASASSSSKRHMLPISLLSAFFVKVVLLQQKPNRCTAYVFISLVWNLDTFNTSPRFKQYMMQFEYVVFSSSYGPILCHQMPNAVIVWSQSTVSSSKAAKHSISFWRWYGEARMWSAVCSSASKLQFDEGIKPYLCICSF